MAEHGLIFTVVHDGTGPLSHEGDGNQAPARPDGPYGSVVAMPTASALPRHGKSDKTKCRDAQPRAAINPWSMAKGVHRGRGCRTGNFFGGIDDLRPRRCSKSANLTPEVTIQGKPPNTDWEGLIAVLYGVHSGAPKHGTGHSVQPTRCTQVDSSSLERR